MLTLETRGRQLQRRLGVMGTVGNTFSGPLAVVTRRCDTGVLRKVVPGATQDTE
jgi:hypothetical protein